MTPMNASGAVFRTIDVERHIEVAVAFRQDAYRCSFDRDEAEGEAAYYRSWLAERIAQHPRGHVHLWKGDAIVGQLEMAVGNWGDGRGYVNLFYLVPEVRGTGLGDRLHQYFVDYMRTEGAWIARLRVTASNRRAVAYYTTHGWRDVGTQPDDDRVHVMEFEFGTGAVPTR
jgi:GNAT superfamily N-acetyltransferase